MKTQHYPSEVCSLLGIYAEFMATHRIKVRIGQKTASVSIDKFTYLCLTEHLKMMDTDTSVTTWVNNRIAENLEAIEHEDGPDNVSNAVRQLINQELYSAELVSRVLRGPN